MELKYVELDGDSQEIRLLNLLPGQGEENIRISLWHTPLIMPKPIRQQRMPFKDILKSLPPGWTAAETQQDEYRILFEEEETGNTSWTHPDPTCDRESWQPLSELPPPDFKPTFEALSYTWGDEVFVEDAIVEYDHACHPQPQVAMRLPLRANLAAALRCLRYPDKIRTLWIDAICINQKDKIECGRQVKNMAPLYKVAQRVIVWLGPKSPSSHIAISTLQHLGSQLEVSRSNVRFRSPQAVEPEWFRAVFPLPYDDKTWQAIKEFLYRPWFERLWIWQEIQLSNSRAMIVCGSDQVPWQVIRRAIICLYCKSELSWPGLRERVEFIRPLTYERGSSSMYMLVNTSRERKCSNPRDHIYGMLSICGPKLVSTIEPQYSLPFHEVYKNVFLTYLKQVERLDLLSGCDFSQKNADGPSWVPNWSLPRHTWPFYGFTFAGGLSRSQTRYIPPDKLRVTGISAGRIRSAGKIVPSSASISEICDVLKTWEPSNVMDGTYITGERLLDAYCSVLRVRFLDEQWPNMSAPSLEYWKKKYLDTLSSTASIAYDKAPVDKIDDHWCFKLIRGRRFIELESGYIGLGPPDAMPGDEICILLGSKVPMIFRPTTSLSSTEEEFQVIGECYVHGVDDAVTILGPLPPDLKVQFDKESSGYGSTHTYKDIRTGQVTQEDPRLPELSEMGWRRAPQRARKPDDPTLWQDFENIATGEVMDSDPRLMPEYLRKIGLGVGLRTFDLC
ncbi:hypothetical protein NHQ30_010192 [Ciborinia camelliae]|nr:hypothetical protein NHQ30_010192 [Ciborinia camelliae]